MSRKMGLSSRVTYAELLGHVRRAGEAIERGEEPEGISPRVWWENEVERLLKAGQPDKAAEVYFSRADDFEGWRELPSDAKLEHRTGCRGGARRERAPRLSVEEVYAQTAYALPTVEALIVPGPPRPYHRPPAPYLRPATQEEICGLSIKRQAQIKRDLEPHQFKKKGS